MARLYVISGDLLGQTYEVGGEVVIGRADDVEVSVPARSVSRQHARLVPLGGGRWRVVDLGSSNGTFLEGIRVDDAVLGDGDVFTVGDVELRLRDGVPSGAEGAAPPAGSEPGPAASAAPTESVMEGETEAGASGELELEFDEDLDAALEDAPRAGGGAGRPDALGPSGDARRAGTGTGAGAGVAATRDRAARRSAAMGGARRAPAVEGGGRPVLQYARTRSGGTDVAQIGGLLRWLLVVLAIALAAGAAYGAFWLTQAGAAG